MLGLLRKLRGYVDPRTDEEVIRSFFEKEEDPEEALKKEILSHWVKDGDEKKIEALKEKVIGAFSFAAPTSDGEHRNDEEAKVEAEKEEASPPISSTTVTNTSTSTPCGLPEVPKSSWILPPKTARRRSSQKYGRQGKRRKR